MKWLAGLSVLALSCAPPDPDRGPKVYDGVGVVVHIGSDQVTLDHGDIPGFMEAMTMTFLVKDSSILSGVEEGMRVRFRIEVDGSAYAVAAITPIPPE
jgi:Cu/Ag efflux protein CusF